MSRETAVNLIGSTKNSMGLKLKEKLDENIYEKGIKISDDESAAVNTDCADFHGERNYKIMPDV